MKKKRRLRLYVWTDFKTDWTSGLAFAIASSEEDARTQLIAAGVYSSSNAASWGDLTVHPLNKRVARYVYGWRLTMKGKTQCKERVLKVPCTFPIDRTSHARGARPETFYKQQRQNLANNKPLEVPPSQIFTK
jgi:hypothetical protein